MSEKDTTHDEKAQNRDLVPTGRLAEKVRQPIWLFGALTAEIDGMRVNGKLLIFFGSYTESRPGKVE